MPLGCWSRDPDWGSQGLHKEVGLHLIFPLKNITVKYPFEIIYTDRMRKSGYQKRWATISIGYDLVTTAYPFWSFQSILLLAYWQMGRPLNKSNLGKFKYQSNTISDCWKKPALFSDFWTRNHNQTLSPSQLNHPLVDHLYNYCGIIFLYSNC